MSLGIRFSRPTFVSTAVQFAVRAMVDVALRPEGVPVAAAEVGRCQGIPRTHVELIFRKLRQGGLVRASRGPGGGGGFRLSRSAQSISVGEIMFAIEGNDKPLPRRPWPTHDPAAQSCAEVWEGAAETLAHYLDSISLDTLVKGHRFNGDGLSCQRLS